MGSKTLDTRRCNRGNAYVPARRTAIGWSCDLHHSQLMGAMQTEPQWASDARLGLFWTIIINTFYTLFWVHPGEAYVDLKKCGHAGLLSGVIPMTLVRLFDFY